MKNWVKFLNELENTNSPKSKRELLNIGIEAYPDLENFLRLVFESKNVLNLKSKSIENHLTIKTNKIFNDIGEKLQYILNTESRNKSLIELDTKKEKTFQDFIVLYNKLKLNRNIFIKQYLEDFFFNCNPEHAKWYSRCLVKDLSCGLGLSTVNKALIDLDKPKIVRFSTQLAVKIKYSNRENEIRELLQKNNNESYIETKEDGVRLRCRNTNPTNPGVWEAVSRVGNPILNVDNILYECNRIFGTTPTDLDGELVANDFFSLSTTIHSKNDTGTIIPRTYKVFDIVTYKEDLSTMKFLDRRWKLLDVLDKKSDIIEVTDMITMTTVSQILAFFEKAIGNGEEGIMIKTNTPYTSKREFWYKLKPTDTLDLQIIGFEYASKGKYSGMRNSIVVASDNRLLESKVGSGLKESDIELFSMGEETDWIGKIIEVKFDSITPINKLGKKSLRNPRFIRLRDDKIVADNI